MTHEQRNWTLNAIRNCYDLCIFQHEVEHLEMLMAKYANPQTEISKDELEDDLLYLDKIYG